MSIQEERSEMEAVIKMEQPAEVDVEVDRSGDEPVLGGETRSEALAEWDVKSSANGDRKVFTFFVVKVPRPIEYSDINKQITRKFEEMKAIDVTLNRIGQERKDVLSKLAEPRTLLKNWRQELKAKFDQSKSFRDEMSSLKDDFELCRSEEDLDAKIARLEEDLQHNTYSLKEEKAIVKRIQTLKASRSKVISNSDARQKRDTIKETSILPLDEQIKELKARIAKAVKDNEEDEERASSLTAQVRTLLDKKTSIKGEIDELRAELRSLNSEDYDKNMAFRHEVFKLAKEHDLENVRSLCQGQVEEMMRMWNTDRSFRLDYVKNNLNSTMVRFGTPDGRSHIPGDSPSEKSVSSGEDKVDRPEDEEAGKAKKEPEEKPAKVEKDDNKEKLKRGGKAKEAKKLKAEFPKKLDGKTFDGNSSDAEAEEEQTRELVEEYTGVEVDEEAQLELERQKRREEEIEKAKAAEARKKRKEEKKKAQREAKLEKERLKKEAEKEKKQRKKAQAVAAESASTSNDSEGGEAAATVTENGTEPEPVESVVQHRGKKAVVQKVRTSVKPLRRRKRSVEQQLRDAFFSHWRIVLAVFILIVAGSTIMAYLM